MQPAFRGTYFRTLAQAADRAHAVPSELPLEPQLAIVDPHHHLVQGAKGRYLGTDYLQDIGAQPIVQTVFIESSSFYRSEGPRELRPVGEVEFAAEVARAHASRTVRLCSGIVGYADLSLGAAVGAVLDAEMAAGGARFKGVRDLVQWDAAGAGRFSSRQAPAGKLRERSFRAGVAQLAGRKLSLDLWAFHTQLAEVTELADEFPELSIILDHGGTPLGVEAYADVRAQVLNSWRAALRELAQRPNVSIKVGGFGMPYLGLALHFPEQPPSSQALASAWRPYVETCIETFGAARAMFESNFPADMQTCAYGALWNAFKRIVGGCPLEDKQALFAGTAQRIYRLEPSASA
jgi:L-fuconolactonase